MINKMVHVFAKRRHALQECMKTCVMLNNKCYSMTTSALILQHAVVQYLYVSSTNITLTWKVIHSPPANVPRISKASMSTTSSTGSNSSVEEDGGLSRHRLIHKNKPKLSLGSSSYNSLNVSGSSSTTSEASTQTDNTNIAVKPAALNMDWGETIPTCIELRHSEPQQQGISNNNHTKKRMSRSSADEKMVKVAVECSIDDEDGDNASTTSSRSSSTRLCDEKDILMDNQAPVVPAKEETESKDAQRSSSLPVELPLSDASPKLANSHPRPVATKVSDIGSDNDESHPPAPGKMTKEGRCLRKQMKKTRSAMKLRSSYGNLERIGDDILVDTTKSHWMALPPPEVTNDLATTQAKLILGLPRSGSSPSLSATIPNNTYKKGHSSTGDKVVAAADAELEPCVSFTKLQIREFDVTLGDNPGGQEGAPVQLDWKYREYGALDVDAYEEHRGTPRTRQELYMQPFHRACLLKDAGLSRQEIKEAAKRMEKIRCQRVRTKKLVPFERVEAFV